jgi:predicted nucleic-acid-binding protein
MISLDTNVVVRVLVNDFADALHLAASGARTFVTFDREPTKAAKRAGTRPPVAAP